MLMRRVIPCLDVRDGRVVKGVSFSNLRDAGDPAQLAERYEADGADELVVLDVSATAEGRRTALRTVESVRSRLSIPLTVGGGVRAADDAARLLDAGADKVGVNTAAVTRPDLLTQLAERFGRQCVVIAIDAALGHPPGAPGERAPSWSVMTHAGKTRTTLDAVRWAVRAASLGAGEVLLTSWDQDGRGNGYDLPLLEAVCAAVSVPVIASGGAATPADLAAALNAGADAVLAASMFHTATWTIARVKADLAARGLEIRL